MTLASTEFLTADNMANLARQVAVFGIIAVGQLLVILTAGIDLSVGSVLGLTGCITAELLVHGIGIVPAILVGMAAGAAIGVFNGSLVAYGKLPPFIVTLGMLGIARGAVLVLTDASTVQPLPDAFGNIANGDFLGLPNLLWIFVVGRGHRVVRAAPHRVRPLRLRGRLEPGVRAPGRRAGHAGAGRGLRDLRACSPRSAACCSPRA